MTVRIELEPWEYEHASQVGIRRYAENWGKADAKHYDHFRMEDNRTAQVAAAVCELAVAKAINQYWGGHVWSGSKHKQYKDLPDVGTNIEVRRIRTSPDAAVRKRQLGKGLILFVAQPEPPELRSIDILGWIDHDEAWEKGKPSSYAPDSTRNIASTLLKSVTEFEGYNNNGQWQEEKT